MLMNQLISSHLKVFSMIVVAACLWLGATGTVLAQETITITGNLSNKTMNAEFAPEAVPITLRMLDGSVALDPITVNPDRLGNFIFPNLDKVEGRVYFLSAEYQGAVYSTTPNATQLEHPLTIQVYESTVDTDVVTITNHTVIVTGADSQERVAEILERVELSNNSDLTLVPELSNAENMSFLRFALPSGSFNLDVRSNLVGGQVLEVDRGFALTTPIPPNDQNSYQIEFIYRLPYSEEPLDLGRSLPFGSRMFRVVVPTSVASPIAAGFNDLGVSQIGDTTFHFLETVNLEDGAKVSLKLEDLPQPSRWYLFTKSLGIWYLAVIAPVFMCLILATGLILCLKTHHSSQIRPIEGSSTTRQELLQRATHIAKRHKEGQLTAQKYTSELNRIKNALVTNELESRFDILSNSKRAH